MKKQRNYPSSRHFATNVFGYSSRALCTMIWRSFDFVLSQAIFIFVRDFVLFFFLLESLFHSFVSITFCLCSFCLPFRFLLKWSFHVVSFVFFSTQKITNCGNSKEQKTLNTNIVRVNWRWQQIRVTGQFVKKLAKFEWLNLQIVGYFLFIKQFYCELFHVNLGLKRILKHISCEQMIK